MNKRDTHYTVCMSFIQFAVKGDICHMRYADSVSPNENLKYMQILQLSVDSLD